MRFGAFDSHCHLDSEELFPDRKEHVQHALDAGVSGIVVPGSRHEIMDHLEVLASGFDQVHIAPGIHPLHLEGLVPDDLGAIYDIHEKIPEKVVAIGEVGLDRYPADVDIYLQMEFFVRQLDIARKLDLPVIIHCRKAYPDLFKVLERFPELPILFHGYGGSAEQALDNLRDNRKFALGGTLTFPNARKAIEVAKRLPMDSILLETDAPFVRIHPPGEGVNGPADVLKVAQRLAEIRKMPLEMIAEITGRNAFEFFGIGTDNII